MFEKGIEKGIEIVKIFNLVHLKNLNFEIKYPKTLHIRCVLYEEK